METRASRATPSSADFRPQFGRAIRSLRELVRDPKSTEKAFDVLFAVGRGDFERQYRRFVADKEGRRLLADRPSLVDALGDRTALERMPDGSFGRAYLDYIDRNAFEADGLVKIEHAVRARWEKEEGLPELDAPRSWFRDRAIVMHDLFHVLTGEDTNPSGEGALLWFTQAQLGGGANLFLSVGATLQLMRVRGASWLREVVRAFTLGRRARRLMTLPFEELLPLSLETVRERAGIVRASRDSSRRTSA